MSDRDDFVSLKQLADEWGVGRSNARKYLIKKGFRAHKRRTADSASQLTLAVTASEAEALRSLRDSEGYGGEKAAPVAGGWFYVIQLVPELDRRRVKLGFTGDVATRLSQHRTAAPTAALLYQWPCRQAWEQAAIECLSVACRLILNEVFECDDMASLKARGDAFFALLPEVDSERKLSEHSPMMGSQEAA